MTMALESVAEEALRLRNLAVLRVRPIARFVIAPFFEEDIYVPGPPRKPKWLQYPGLYKVLPIQFLIESGGTDSYITRISKHSTRNSPPSTMITTDHLDINNPAVGFFVQEDGEMKSVEPESDQARMMVYSLSQVLHR